MYNVENLSCVWMTKTFQKLLGHHFQSMLHLMHHSVLTDIFFVFFRFLFESNPFSHLHYYERIVNACMNYLFIYLFLNCWPEILQCEESMFVAILIFLFIFFPLYTSIAASLRWCAFPIKHSEFIWFSRGYFHFFNILEYQ